MDQLLNNNSSVLIIGGYGNLGRSIVNQLIKKNWHIFIIGHNQLENNSTLTNGKNIDTFFINTIFTHSKQSLKQEIELLYKAIDTFFLEKKILGFNAILNCAGGFDMCNIKSIDFILNGQELIEKNYLSVLLTANLSSKYLLKNSLILITGAAKAFKESCSDMLLYQASKTAAHSVGLSLKDSKELPEGACVITILPDIFDTPQNRKAMPLEDFTKWTSTDLTSELIYMWLIGLNRPKSGSFCLLKTLNGKILPEFV